MLVSARILCRKIASSYHFRVVASSAVGIVLHYPQQIPATESPSIFAFLGLTRHAAERIFLPLPIGYASFLPGMRAGIAAK